MDNSIPMPGNTLLTVGDPVPDYLHASLAPAQRILREWTTYRVQVSHATRLRVGTQILSADVIASHEGTPHGHFQIVFENQLGRTQLVPLRGNEPCGEPIDIEVIAGKFPEIDHSVRFLEGTLADIFSRGSVLPFFTSATTGRSIRDSYVAPNDLFAFHFFRHRGKEIIRATQAVLGSPHRVLNDEPELVRVHEVRRMDRETIQHMLQTAIQRGSGPSRTQEGSALQRLQPERVLQRLPVESHDTPENRFIVTACRRMLSALDRINRAPWYRNGPIVALDRQRLADIDTHLRQVTRDPRFMLLAPSIRLPAQSRVLQRRDGYRELTLLWNDLHRIREPVFEAMEHAIDLRDIATLYEYWLLFELIDRIEHSTGVTPVVRRPFDPLGRPTGEYRIGFPGFGTLSYQSSFSGKAVYSGITLRPDYVWETVDSRRIVMDAKFRLRYPWPKDDEEIMLDQSRAKTDDIAKMHAYRDAIEGVAAAIVLYPGANTDFRTTSGERLDIDIDNIITGEIEGIGSIAMSPVQTSEPREGTIQ